MHSFNCWRLTGPDRSFHETKHEAKIRTRFPTSANHDLSASLIDPEAYDASEQQFAASLEQMINSGGLGTMGFGLPAAIGAAVACPDVPSVLLTGDGSFQMNIQELGTARQFDIPVKCVIMDNGYLGMVRQWQELFWDRRYSNVDMGSWPDWVKLADAYGATGVLLTDKTTLVDDLRAALATPGPVVVDVKVTREENTYPMIAPGAAAREMVG